MLLLLYVVLYFAKGIRYEKIGRKMGSDTGSYPGCFFDGCPGHGIGGKSLSDNGHAAGGSGAAETRL